MQQKKCNLHFSPNPPTNEVSYISAGPPKKIGVKWAGMTHHAETSFDLPNYVKPTSLHRISLERVTVVPKNTSSSMRENEFAVADAVEGASRPLHSQVVHLLGTIHLDQSYLHSPKRLLSNAETLGRLHLNAAGPNR